MGLGQNTIFELEKIVLEMDGGDEGDGRIGLLSTTHVHKENEVAAKRHTCHRVLERRHARQGTYV